ncbi:MAG: pyruvate dehydrogenase complex dihydrolipoamide acetyltransferase [Rhodobacter sp.]|nr:pyruvate dehydrogenase complex dihydrolipoamide acetyltransferase [Rhodobacter sp.]MCA3513389.1 pyruvate dehydrogenase complex dihydrolipoamide acetyltransferase [Rhodobacter sp.]MCA3518648.1 pyruvate dehydrogenase complex dihydrolipoamide acetyltransferase [Rhodobacter sp.]MCA3522622.1 pyruvate dehydrogenase complex dihydrolipoamide acetyltransferase [Rhodobacter sp.]MCA3527097.1 pyruvate dehydrogenase complex dihydrolipoamide acetyltransferase [Rhodobacter sp.]
MATEILMPALSPTMEEGTLAKWLVKAGDAVKSGQILAEIETDKATMEFEAVDEGIIGKLLVAEGTAGVKVNTPIAMMLEDGERADAAPAPKAPAAQPAAAAAMPAATASAVPAAAPAKGARVFASPLARRIAAEKGLDLAGVKGSGPHGRIVKADVEALSKPAAAPVAAAMPAPAPAPAAAAPALATGATAETVARIFADRSYDVVELDGMRKTIAARLTEAKQTIPHFYLRRSAQLDALLAFRETLNRQLESRSIKLSVNDFIIKACALALQQVPDANAVWAGDRIFRLRPSDVAVAVAIEGGLFTPVLRDAHQKSISTLSAEMKDLAARARTRKLAPHEYQGGSFAISNLGMFGIENFDAVINPPHGSILAVGAGLKTPVAGKDGSITVATVMSMTLSVDHRVIDGALGAEFLKAIIGNLENPVAMLA